ncbi:hypothetical protein GRF29_77g355847 [Pseudopithomyces chartarum]|uniref:CAP-Gly domain-containing protein n=1 Tax=Pseudopithomyces chartarum TaxID=1892770 RepID=A0AAN6LWA6_9PLEO|nr:hypothetical protein GRF29_77g355847 [Pseudopithomyces chartarum]
MGADGRELEVGDLVDVPGSMTGVVKFIGSVRGKPGVFAGVELSKQFAARGKNDGDVDGVPGSGIFLPVHRAKKRSPGTNLPPTPTTPSYGSKFSASTRERPIYSPEIPPVPSFSKSLGPGVRAPSPQLKPPTRPSLPRPESPYRKQPSLTPTPSRNGSITPSGFSKSVGGGPPRFNHSPAPRNPSFQKPRTPGPTRPYSRSSSHLGQQDTISEDLETTPTGNRVSNDSTRSFKNRTPGAGASRSDEEVQRLTKLLDERDRQLKEQASSLAEMETSLAEIQSMLPDDGMSFGSRNSIDEPQDVAQLKALLREKTEKINMLTQDFDSHRADFRSTIDALELASTETERVYERKVEDMQEEIRELHSRSEDVATVAMQLKQLEELVQELEEGLEDARRGEAEARGEVEFLRGEVERGRSELKREREKAAAAIKDAGAIADGPTSPGARDLEQRDDEIRGLKAIIHSLSSGSNEDHRRSPLSRQESHIDPEELRTAHARLEESEREKEDLRDLIERKAFREEELEREIELLKEQLTASTQRESVVSNNPSEYTLREEKHSSGHDSKGTVLSWKDTPRHNPPPTFDPTPESADSHSTTDGGDVCTNGDNDVVIEGLRTLSLSPDDARPPIRTPSKSSGNAPSAPLPPPVFPASPSATKLVPPKGGEKADPDKWCALCESEGHDVTACPMEDEF